MAETGVATEAQAMAAPLQAVDAASHVVPAAWFGTVVPTAGVAWAGKSTRREAERAQLGGTDGAFWAELGRCCRTAAVVARTGIGATAAVAAAGLGR